MKRLFKILFVILLFVFSFNIYAQEVTPDYLDGRERSQMENYGVHKHWTIDEHNLPNVLRTPYVDVTRKIYDYSNILKDSEEEEIKKLMNEYIEHTGMDIVFVTINMPYTYDSMNEDYAADFYDYNDFGLTDKHYSGVILLRNTYEQDPYFNVYTFGEAQLYYDFDRCESMLDDIYPDFHSGNYVEGLKIFIEDFTRYYDSGVALPDYYVDDDGYIHKDKGAFNAPVGIAGIVGSAISGLTVLGMSKKNKMIHKATNASDYEKKDSTVFRSRVDQFLHTHTSRHRISSDSSGGGGGGFSSSSGSSGGGHGGGGGRHG